MGSSSHSNLRITFIRSRKKGWETFSEHTSIKAIHFQFLFLTFIKATHTIIYVRITVLYKIDKGQLFQKVIRRFLIQHVTNMKTVHKNQIIRWPNQSSPQMFDTYHFYTIYISWFNLITVDEFHKRLIRSEVFPVAYLQPKLPLANIFLKQPYFNSAQETPDRFS